MAEQTPEQSNESPTLDKAKIDKVVQTAVYATQKIGAALMKVSSDIISMIFKH